jgi:predicted AAA+ superfamily ATPase
LKYIAVDDPVLIDQYTSLTASQWNEYFPHAILDEVQKVPALIESIKAVYDQFPETTYVLTGSSQFLLLKKVRESLAGRCAIFELFPLTIPELRTEKWDGDIRLSFFQEFLQKGSLPDVLPSFMMDPDYAVCEKLFQYFITNGGYPFLTRTRMKDNERFEWLTDYIRTYLEHDVRDLADFRSLEPFIKVQRMTALMTGNLLNYAELAKDAGITANTARRFVNYLEISYQAILLQPWSRNKQKRLVKSPKLHYLDPGVQKAIIQKRGSPAGNEYESAVIAEIYKQMKNILFPGSFYHFRTVDGREVDLLIETEKGYYAIDVKMARRVSEVDARHLKGLGPILDKPLLYSFLLSNDPAARTISENILALPAAMFLS